MKGIAGCMIIKHWRHADTNFLFTASQCSNTLKAKKRSSRERCGASVSSMNSSLEVSNWRERERYSFLYLELAKRLVFAGFR